MPRTRIITGGDVELSDLTDHTGLRIRHVRVRDSLVRGPAILLASDELVDRNRFRGRPDVIVTNLDETAAAILVLVDAEFVDCTFEDVYLAAQPEEIERLTDRIIAV